MLTPRAVFDAVGGLSLTLPINYNDVDYCLKLRYRGWRVVFTPEAQLYHYETSSRPIAEVDTAELDQLHGRWLDYRVNDPLLQPELRPRAGRLHDPGPLHRRQHHARPPHHTHVRSASTRPARRPTSSCSRTRSGVNDELSRRAVLVLLGTGAAAVAGAAYVAFTDDPPGDGGPGNGRGARRGGRHHARRRASLRRARYLAAEPSEASSEELASLVGLEAPADDRAAIEAEIIQAREQIRADFTHDDVVDVDGWQLSRTEARLCALAALAA